MDEVLTDSDSVSMSHSLESTVYFSSDDEDDNNRILFWIILLAVVNEFGGLRSDKLQDITTIICDLCFGKE